MMITGLMIPPPPHVNLYLRPPQPAGMGYPPATRATIPAAALGRTQALTSGEYSTTGDRKKRKLIEVYHTLKSELLHDPTFDFTDESRQWTHGMLDYNVPVGRLSRVYSTINCYQASQDGKELSDEENFLACVLGWCIQWLQAYLLVVDDIIDNSYTRNGQPCWFRLHQVGMTATNDASILQAQIFRILKKHFRDQPYYALLLDLFNEVIFQTSYGQMLDVLTPHEKDISEYSMKLYRCIAKYKGAYFTMYLPVACALILAGKQLDDPSEVVDILAEITTYYQIQNDYEDCFGDPEVTGKVGTDIEDHKCSWLIVKALEHADGEQKKILYENYGENDPACIAKVKEIYASLDLQNIYKQCQKESFEELKKSVEMHPSKAVQAIWDTLERMTNLMDPSS